MTLLVAIATHSHILLGGDNRMTLVMMKVYLKIR